MGLVNQARRDALAKGEKTYLSEKPCKHCGTHVKFTQSYSCVECHKRRSLEKLNNEELMEKYRTPEKQRERLKRWRKENPDKHQQQWLRDPTKASRMAKRRARKSNQTPEDANNDIIKSIYLKCKQISEETGIPHEVDHIIPIAKGGLHHQDNLRIITRSENRSKGCKIDD